MKVLPMKKYVVLMSVSVLIMFSMVAYGHSGRTDANGGHHDYDNVSGLGSYHYHHGYPAHLHENGICPYESYSSNDTQASKFDTFEGGSMFLKPPYNQNSSTIKVEEPEEERLEELDDGTILAFLLIAPLICIFIWQISESFVKKKLAERKLKKERLKEEKERLRIEAEKARIAAEKEKTDFIAMYSNKTQTEILKMVQAPEGVHLDKNNLPYKYVDGINIYEVYVTSNGKRYHTRTCRYAYWGTKVNLVQTYKFPCSMCRPVIDNLIWYREYIEIIRKLKQYGFEINNSDANLGNIVTK